MAFDVSAFRASFPEFADTEKYPTTQITFWSDLAELQVRECVWKTALFKGQSLYTAHQITLAERAAKTASLGGTPGTFGGVANTKTVGGGTVGYDSQNTFEKDAGWWNLTNYGQQFWRLVQIFGAGAIQL